MAMPKSTQTRVVEMITNTTGIPTSHTHAQFNNHNILVELWSVCDVGMLVVLLLLAVEYFLALPSLLPSAIFYTHSTCLLGVTLIHKNLE